MAYIIESINEESEKTGLPLCWSNSEGFTAGDNYDTFSEEERNTLNLPVGGKWTEVPWKA